MNTLKILIADDHALVRMGIAALLTTQRDIDVVGQAKTARKRSRKPCASSRTSSSWT